MQLITVLVAVAAIAAAGLLYSHQGRQFKLNPQPGYKLDPARGAALAKPVQPGAFHPDDLPHIQGLIALGWLDDDVKCTEEPPISCLPDGHVARLVLPSRGLTGSLPKQLFKFSQLRHLVLAKNQLEGAIPNEIQNLKNLELLSLGFNNLTGELPEGLFHLSSLKKLMLAHNQLSGPISDSLCYAFRWLTKLWLDHNQFTGSIPPCIGTFIFLETLALSHNQLTGEIPPGIIDLQPLQILDLGHNNLEGSLNPLLGNLKRIVKLDLSYNKLTGRVPSSISEMLVLDYLDLKNNSFSCPFPRVCVPALCGVCIPRDCSNQQSAVDPKSAETEIKNELED